MPWEWLVERHIDEVLDEERARWSDAGEGRSEAIDALADFLVGGKRVRPLCCLWGYAGAGGSQEPALVRRAARVAVALEFLHTFALVHDDVMDGSLTRRGRPSVHVGFETTHRQRDWYGDGGRYGTAMAVLVGDVAFAIAGRLVADLPAGARLVWHDLVRDLTVGQYLDVTGGAGGIRDVSYASRVARLKTGAYTVERPLQLGAALVAGREATTSEAVAAAYSAYGRPVGEAFQLRDDLLGVFGDPALTGKPVGDDLRAGKPTMLVAFAQARCTDADAALLRGLGTEELDDATVAAIADLLERCGARWYVERRIARLVSEATHALDEAPVAPAVTAHLRAVAEGLARPDGW